MVSSLYIKHVSVRSTDMDANTAGLLEKYRLHIEVFS